MALLIIIVYARSAPEVSMKVEYRRVQFLSFHKDDQRLKFQENDIRMHKSN